MLERRLLKGSIVVKKAYCDWDRYKVFKATMHEAAFELIEITLFALVEQGVLKKLVVGAKREPQIRALFKA